MRVSYNVVKNIQMQNKNEGKSQQSNRKDSSPYDKMLNQKLMPSTPTMNKPAPVVVGDSQSEYDMYNNNIKNRNSKLNKGSAYERDIDEDNIEVKDTKIDFYAQNQVENNDINLGQNTKMVLDFSNN